MSDETYAVVLQSQTNQRWRCKILNRPDYPDCTCALPSKDKHRFLVEIGAVVRIDTTDFDRGDGYADILELVSDAKELKKLRKAGTIPHEEDMPKPTVSPHVKYSKSDKKAAVHAMHHNHERAMCDDDEVAERNRPRTPEQAEAVCPREVVDATDEMRGNVGGDKEGAAFALPPPVSASAAPPSPGQNHRMTKGEKWAKKKEDQLQQKHEQEVAAQREIAKKLSAQPQENCSVDDL